MDKFLYYINVLVYLTGLAWYSIIQFIIIGIIAAAISGKKQSKKNKEAENLPVDVDTGDPQQEVHRRYMSTKELKEKIYMAGGSDSVGEKKGILTLKELDFLHKLVDACIKVNQKENGYPPVKAEDIKIEWIDDEVTNNGKNSGKEHSNSD